MAAPDPSKLDLQQILQRVYDEAAGKLRTSATASIGDITVAVDLSPADDGVYIADKDTGNKLKVNAELPPEMMEEREVYNAARRAKNGEAVSNPSEEQPLLAPEDRAKYDEMKKQVNFNVLNRLK